MPLKKVFQDKPCATCGAMFNRALMPSGRLEDATIFMKRAHCSLTCANTRKTLKPQSYLWRSRKFKGSCCEACGETRKLHVHHCDQNQANNEPSNLQTLCQWCHDFWHATAKRVGRSVAGRMPNLGGLTLRMESPALPKASPIGWTELEPSATDKSLPVPLPRGESSLEAVEP